MASTIYSPSAFSVNPLLVSLAANEGDRPVKRKF